MKASLSKSVNSRHWKPLSIEQENCIDPLILGDSDEEAGTNVGVSRQTVWTWRNTHPYFRICLERRRGDLYRTSCERLRSLVSRAIQNIAGAIEEGSVPLGVELLKIVGIHGDDGGVKKVAGLQVARDDPDMSWRRWPSSACTMLRAASRRPSTTP
jgi:hypothetical protein